MNVSMRVHDGCKNLLWWPLVISDVACSCYEIITGWDIYYIGGVLFYTASLLFVLSYSVPV